MAEVRIENVWKYYGEVEAVKDVSFTCQNEEFLALLGPSGCGKSSTLRMIAGLEKISKGDIYIGGQLVNDLEPRERNIAMAFETYALYPPLDTYGNIAYPLRVAGMDKNQIDQRVHDVAEMLEIEDILDQNPHELSGGHQQRISLARALVRDPTVFLLDEPISHLDEHQRVRLRTRIRELHEDLQATTLYVTHDQEEAVTLADRIAIMQSGQLQQLGDYQQLFEEPANHFVGGFVGSPPMNFFSGQLMDGGIFTSRDFKGEFKLPAQLNLNGRKGEMIMGIRPEHITIQQETDHNTAEAKVQVIEFLGDHQILTAELNGTELKIRTTAEHRYNQNDTAIVNFPPDHIHLFDPETGERLL